MLKLYLYYMYYDFALYSENCLADPLYISV